MHNTTLVNELSHAAKGQCAPIEAWLTTNMGLLYTMITIYMSMNNYVNWWCIETNSNTKIRTLTQLSQTKITNYLRKNNRNIAQSSKFSKQSCKIHTAIIK